MALSVFIYFFSILVLRQSYNGKSFVWMGLDTLIDGCRWSRVSFMIIWLIYNWYEVMGTIATSELSTSSQKIRDDRCDQTRRFNLNTWWHQIYIPNILTLTYWYHGEEYCNLLLEEPLSSWLLHQSSYWHPWNQTQRNRLLYQRNTKIQNWGASADPFY